MSDRKHLLDHLLDPNQVVVFDGAMGTMLYSKGVFINQCYDELDLRAPDLVREVHRAYVKAGAEVIETNTFGASRTKLVAATVSNRRCTRSTRPQQNSLASEAGDNVLVAGAVGPLGVRLEPYGPTSLEEARAIFAEQMQGLKDGGADFFILETFADLAEIEQGILAARECRSGHAGRRADDDRNRLPHAIRRIAGGHRKGARCVRRGHHRTQLLCWPADDSRRHREDDESHAQENQRAAKRRNAARSSGPQHVHGEPRIHGDVRRAPRTRRRKGRRRMLRNNPGAHRRDGRRHSSACRPARRECRSADRRTRRIRDRSARGQGVEPVPFGERSKFAGKIARGEFVTSVEIVPPRGVDASQDARATHSELKDAGVDAVNVPDGPRAQSRMGALLTSLLIEQQVGIETVTHYCCRDRNLLGMLSDLLGASAIGLRNMLIITGDPPKMGPYPNATAVFDIDAIGLTNLVSNLNHGLDPGGNAIGAPTSVRDRCRRQSGSDRRRARAEALHLES